MPIKFRTGLKSFVYKGKLISTEDALKDKALVDELVTIGANIFELESEEPAPSGKPGRAPSTKKDKK